MVRGFDYSWSSKTGKNANTRWKKKLEPNKNLNWHF